jgi:hypothetical protein
MGHLWLPADSVDLVDELTEKELCHMLDEDALQ